MYDIIAFGVVGVVLEVLLGVYFKSKMNEPGMLEAFLILQINLSTLLASGLVTLFLRSILPSYPILLAIVGLLTWKLAKRHYSCSIPKEFLISEFEYEQFKLHLNGPSERQEQELRVTAPQ